MTTILEWLDTLIEQWFASIEADWDRLASRYVD